jgi:hypothetical protein
MAYSPHTWVDDDTSKPLSATRLSEMEAGIEDADNRLTTVEAQITAPVVITYAATITPDAAAGSLFYCVATGNLTLTEPTNATNGKFVTVAIQASGANRILTLPDGALMTIPSGEWWIGKLLYLGTPAVWLLTEGI